MRLSEFTHVDALGAEAAVAYLHAVTAAMAPIKAQLRVLLDPRPGDRLLDLGCGLGDDARALAAAVQPGGHVDAVDASAAMIAAARTRTDGTDVVSFVLADAAAVPFPDASFDGVRAERLLQHVREPEAVIREAARVLRPGARLVLCEPDWLSLRITGDAGTAGHTIEQQMRARIRHPGIGRALASLTAAAGLRIRLLHELPLQPRDRTIVRRLAGDAAEAVSVSVVAVKAVKPPEPPFA